MSEQLVASQERFLMFIRRFLLEHPPIVEEKNYPIFVPINLSTIFATLYHIGLLFIFWLLGVYSLSLFNIVSASMWAFAFYLNRKGFHFASVTVFSIEVFLHQILCVIIIGWAAGFQYFILLIPMGVFLLTPGRNLLKIIIVLISGLIFAFLDYFFRNAVPLFVLEPLTLKIINCANIAAVIVTEALAVLYFNMKMIETEKALREEHKKSEALLLNILPKSIAERLKSGSEVIADRFENVSILFLDIVKFTSISEKVSAQKVVAFLNNLFLIFDELTEKYKLEKIKTIGDAYMVAAGIPEPCDDHAERVAQMSIDIKNSLKVYNKENEDNVKVRIGINSGPAVAGVIGKKKFAYDIWGDTVNTASRMEAYCEPGEIQVAEATYHLLKDKYDFMYRGVINVKGKGGLPTYFLKS